MREVLTYLLPYYIGVRKQLKKRLSQRELITLLENTKTQCGICHCAMEVFKVHIYGDEEFVGKYMKPGTVHWCEMPKSIYTAPKHNRQKIIATFDRRIQIMEELLKQ